MLLGAFAMVVSFWLPARPHARLAGMFVGYGVAVIQFLSLGSIVESPEVGYFCFSGIVTGVMLIGIAALPLKPLQTLGLGGAIAATYGIAIPRVFSQLAGQSGIELVFVAQVVFLWAALTMVVYRQRVLAYLVRCSAREALEELRHAQARLLVSENAHAQSRFADERYAEILAGAETAGRGSAARLKETIERMGYLTNLDRAEEQTVDLNELCRETAASLKSHLEAKTDLYCDLGVLPPLRRRPQQISAVLSNLLRNAAEAIESRGRITVSTRKREGNVVLESDDRNRGISSAQLATLFEPLCQVENGRVATTNWGLFVSRMIVSEHGGQLDIDSDVGKGTTAKIVLPWL